MAEKVATFMGFKGAQGPSAAEIAIQNAQAAAAERESILAMQQAAANMSGNSLRGALRFNDDRKKSTLGG